MSYDITIDRTYYAENTIGELKTKSGFKCYTVELPDKGNKAYISCIPEGVYQWSKSTYKDGKKCLRISNVRGRSGILFHIANYHYELLGCIAPNTGLSDSKGFISGTESTKAFENLFEILPNKGTLQIKKKDILKNHC